MITQKGQRGKLEQYLNVNQTMEIVMSVSGGSVYDFTCFGLDEQGKLSNEDFMIFYNQTQSPGGEIRYQVEGNGAQFLVNLNQIPDKLQKLAFTVSIDGAGTMGMIQSHGVQIRQNNQTLLELSLSGADFQKETAVISMELYKKDGWRFAMTASGFNGGLADLLRNYGGEVEESQPIPEAKTAEPQARPIPEVKAAEPQVQPIPETKVAEPQVQSAPEAKTAEPQARPVPEVKIAEPQARPVPEVKVAEPQVQPIPETKVAEPQVQPIPAQTQPTGRISLEKKLEQNAPNLVSLAKPLQLELEKRSLLDCVARVALVLDISGSMTGRYKDGTVQEIVNKTLPLAVQFDDDGELDFWYYGTTCRKMPSVNMGNYETAVPEDWKQLMRTLGGSNNEVIVMEDIVREYKGSKLPVYVLFITDGGISRAGTIKRILKEVSTEPVFWQFVGVGGRNYGILENLDTMDGRYVDNANFFALDDFRKVSNPDLYGRLLNEFPQWLKEIRAKGMIL